LYVLKSLFKPAFYLG